MMGNEQYKVLVVDDSADNREAVRDLLKIDGYTVEEATNGTEALDRTAQFQPHVYLIDVVMPEMDGLQLLKELHMAENSSVAIMMTGRESLHDAKQAMESGAFSYVGKPLHYQELHEQVSKAIAAVRVKLDKQLYQAELEKKVAERTQELQDALHIVENQHQRLDAIINSIGDALLAVDEERKVMLTNHKFHQIFKKPFWDIVGQKLESISDDADFVVELQALVQSDCQSAHISRRLSFRNGNGKDREFDVRVSEIRNKHNELIGKIILFGDRPASV